MVFWKRELRELEASGHRFEDIFRIFSTEFTDTPFSLQFTAGQTQRMSYAELTALTNRLARVLHAHFAGQEGAFLAIRMENSPLWVAAFFGTLMAGERRWRAARMAGLSEVPVVVLEADDRTVMELALVENLQRQDLNPMEEAEGYQRLMKEYGLTQEEAAARVGKSRPAVANALRLLLLPEEVRSLVEDGTISAGHARAILSLPAARLQKAAAQKIVALRLSVRQAEAMCKRMLQEEEKPEPKPAPLTVDYVAECEKSLTRRLDRKVRIVNGKRKGRFELEFYGQEDLQRLYDALLALGKTEEKPECLN